MSKEPSIPWNTFPEGKLTKHADTIWVVRTGVVVNRPKRQKRFEDTYVSLATVEGEGNSILGYVLQLKREFQKVFAQDSYVSLLADVEAHKDPKVLFKDQKVYLYRFNSSKNPSYWFLYRNRTT
jgi:hypothetical protein